MAASPFSGVAMIFPESGRAGWLTWEEGATPSSANAVCPQPGLTRHWGWRFVEPVANLVELDALLDQHHGPIAEESAATMESQFVTPALMGMWGERVASKR